ADAHDAPEARIDEDEEADAASLPAPPRRHTTRFGGLLFLLRVLGELELPAALQAEGPFADRPLDWMLHRLALAIVPARPDDPGWIELRLATEEISVELRRAGLDLDPGWLPWLGAVVRFAYVCGVRSCCAPRAGRHAEPPARARDRSHRGEARRSRRGGGAR